MSITNDPAYRELAKELVELRRLVHGVGRPQLNRSSLENGSINTYDQDGQVSTSYGRLPDGSFGTGVLSGPTPPTPSAPTVRVLNGVGLEITWDGTYTGATDTFPLSGGRLEVYVHNSVPITGAIAPRSAITSPRGGTITLSVDYDTSLFVAFALRAESGKLSGISQAVGPFTVTRATAEDLDVDFEALAGTKIFYQDEAPVTDKADLWLDLDPVSGNHVAKRYNPSTGTWETLNDQRVVEALLEAQAASESAQQAGIDALAAQGTADAANTLANAAKTEADRKVVVYRQAEPPTGLTAADTNDLWIDTNDSNKLYAWSGSAWVVSDDQRIADALSTANTANTTAASKTTIFAQDNAPSTTGRTNGDLWFDTNDGNKQYIWNGAWTERKLGAAAISATARDLGAITVYRQATAPSSGVINGDFWIRDTDNRIHVRVNGAWVESKDTDINAAVSAAATAQATADGKMRIFTQPNEPTGMTAGDEGDLWIDTDQGNATYTYTTGTTVKRTNIFANPRAATLNGWGRTAGTGGVSTLTHVTSGGPSAISVSTFARTTWTTATTAVGGGIYLGPASVNDVYVIPVTPGQQITGSVYVRSSKAQTMSVSMEFRDAAGTLFSILTPGTSTSVAANTWTRLSHTVTVPADAVRLSVAAYSRTGGTVWNVNDTLDVTGALVEIGTLGSYFDGSSGGEAIWNGDTDAATSTTWQAGPAGGLAWRPNKLRASAIEPKSLVAKDIIATGTITAALLEAMMVLTNTVIAGAPLGTHARLSPAGLKVYRQDPVDGVPNEVIRLATDTNDYFGVVDQNGSLVASIDDTGAGNFRTINAREDVNIKGTPLTLLLGAASGAGNGNNAISGAYHYIGSAPVELVGIEGTSGITGEVGVVEMSVEVSSGRHYWIGWDIELYQSTGTAVDVRIRNGDTNPPTTSSPQIMFRRSPGPHTLTRSTFQRMGYWKPSRTGTHRLLLTVFRGEGTGAFDVSLGINPGLTVIDLGPFKSTAASANRGGNNGGGAAAPPPVRQYFWEGGPQGVRTFAGTSGFPERLQGAGTIVQGYDPSGTNGDGGGYMWFNLPSITGTVDRVELYTYWEHWYYNSGGTAIINFAQGPISSGDFNPNKVHTDIHIGGFPKPGGRTVVFDRPNWAGVLDAFRNSAPRRTDHVTLGRSGNTNLTFYGRCFAWDTRLRIWYTQ